jgi:multidrug efflux pump subunit AcrA (membrane-fusion protein)
MKIRWANWLVVALALAGAGTTVAIVAVGDKSYPVAAPVAAPPAKPFPHVVSGAGLIEAASENIAVGTPLPGVVGQVFVRVGQTVAAGEPLFALDARQIDADIAARAAAVEVARTRISELQALEREAQDQLARVRDLPDARAVSREEIVRREIAALAARARVKAAQAALAQAGAEAAAARTEKGRMTVRAPIAGEVLQLNVRVGEFAGAGNAMPLLVLGDTRTLHVRVDIDENDAWRVRKGAQAVAYVRGSNDLSTPARFVRFEPLVVPKRSLTGNSAERVDTRVLQVLFAFPRQRLPVYVGQQMDVMIEAAPISPALGGGNV